MEIQMTIQNRLLISIILIIAAISGTYSYISYSTVKSEYLQGIDGKLLTAAHMARLTVPENYHDGITDENSVSRVRFDQIVHNYNELCLKLGLEYIWSLMLIDGKIVFTTSTSPSKDVTQMDHAPFFKVHHNPTAYTRTFDTMKVHFSDNLDKWGHIRLVLTPHLDSQGRKYLFGASVRIDALNIKLRDAAVGSLGIFFVTFLIGVGISFALARTISRPISDLGRAAEKIADGNFDHEIEVSGSGEIASFSRSIKRMGLAIRERFTERERAEKALREGEARLRLLLDGVSVGIGVENLEGQTIQANEGWAKILGYTTEELQKMRFNEYTHPDYAAEDVRLFRELAAGNRDRYQMEKRYVSKSESEVWGRLTRSLVRDEHGNPEYCLGMVEDISERKRAEEALRGREAQVTSLINGSPAGFFFKDLDRRYVLLNQTYLDFHGLTRATIIGKRAEDFQPPDHAERTFSEDRQVLETRRPIHKEETLISGDGTARHFSLSKFPVTDSDGTLLGLGGMSIDITERYAMERQLVQAQKMEAVGQLTGGVAHDFNNLLAVVSLNLELVQDQIEGNPHLNELIGRSLSAVQRGATLTQRLLSFSRRQSLSPESTELGRLITDVEDMLRRTLGETIELHVRSADDAWPVLVDAHQLESAILNLALNARDAMPDGGTLTIETANAPLDEGYTDEYDDLQAGDYVRLAISDTGTGISRENLEHVIEPFFTTKDVGKGSGLGLSMVYGLIKQSKGHISIYSEVGEGTSVKLYLPRDASQEIDTPSTKANGTMSYKGHERILVVEDEEEVRRVAVEILENEGYEIIEAADGLEALEEMGNAESIDLLFTDMVLPQGMSGLELAVKAEERQPGLRTLFTTGYAENAVIHDDRLDNGVNLISKPYRRADLLKRVRTVIDAPAE